MKTEKQLNAALKALSYNALLLFVIIFLVTYACVSFIALNFNFQKWNWLHRVIFILAQLYSLHKILDFYFSLDEKYRKQLQDIKDNKNL